MKTGWDPIDELFGDDNDNMPTWACILFIVLLVVAVIGKIL